MGPSSGETFIILSSDSIPRLFQRVHSTPKDGQDSALLRKGDSLLVNFELSQFFSLFAYVDSPRFDLASEAFATFRELLLRFFLFFNKVQGSRSHTI